jgi:glycosyltransferase involved in cell wall biosynthesis
MRILIMAHNYRFLATAQRGRQIGEALAKRGHDVALCTVSRARKWRHSWQKTGGVRNYEGAHWLQNLSGEGYAPIDVLTRMGIALTGRWDVAHMLDHKPMVAFPGLAAKLTGATLIADWVDWWGGPGGINDVPRRRFPIVGRIENHLEMHTKRAAHGVVTISTVLAERARNMGIPDAQILHMPNGADMANIQPVPLAEARAQLNVPLERKMVGYLGMSQHDAHVMFDVMQRVPELWLMVTGPANPGLTAAAQQAGVADRIWQTGFVDDGDLKYYLSAANIMCLPLRDDAASRGRLAGKLLYYMAAGRPTVVSPVGDHKEIIERHKAGVLADVAGFGDAVLALINDPARSAALGANARLAAEQHFNWDVLANGLESFYLRMRDKTNGHARTAGAVAGD